MNIYDCNEFSNPDCPYVSIEEFNATSIKQGLFHIVHHNIRSFNKNFDELDNRFEWIGKSAAVLTILIKQVLLQLYRLERVLK